MRRDMVLEQAERDIHVRAHEVFRPAHLDVGVRAVMSDELQRERRHGSAGVAGARRDGHHRTHPPMEGDEGRLQTRHDLLVLAHADDRVALQAHRHEVLLQLTAGHLEELRQDLARVLELRSRDERGVSGDVGHRDVTGGDRHASIIRSASWTYRGAVIPSAIERTVSRVSISLAGLSGRRRTMRGKRIAYPESWRSLSWIWSNATSITVSGRTTRSRPRSRVVDARKCSVIVAISLSVRPEYALPTLRSRSPSRTAKV